MYDLLQQLLMAFVAAVLTAVANNYLQNKRFDQEYKKLQKQQQLDIRKELIMRSHDIYFKFTKAWGQRISNQLNLNLSPTEKKEILGLLLEIMYCSHDSTIKILAYNAIQELKLSQPKSNFPCLEELNRHIIDAPVNDSNISS